MNFKYNIFALTLLVCLSTFVAAEDQAKATTIDTMKKTEMPATEQKMEDTMLATDLEKGTEMKQTPESSVTTVGDFIIHPLVAFRPRPAVTPADTDMIEGKQADSSSTTTAAPWPVFGLGYGQAIGSSLSNVAGQITGWLNDRIQLPALESPVRESTTTSSTTTTPRPDVIVRVQHRPAITVNDKRKRPTLNNNDFPEDDYEQDENEVDEEEEEEIEEEDEGDYEEEEEEIEDVRPQRRPVRRPVRRQQQQTQRQTNRRPINNRRQQFNRFDDYAEDDSDDDYYYSPQLSSKRSQSQNNFLNLGQQNLLNQIRLLTRGQTPAELAETMQKTNPERNHGTFLVRRNGQTVYLAPELETEETSFQFPQPPLTKPLKVNGQVQQYITIPYNQLGLVPPQGASGVAEGIQSQPLILSIPQSALKQLNSKDKNHGPLVTPNAVPLFTEASLADIFKPPQIPPSRTQPGMTHHSGNTLQATYTPVVVFTPNGATKVRPSTVVEKSPASLNIKQVKTEEAYIIVNDDEEEEGRKAKDATQFYQLPKNGARFGVRKGRELDQTNSPAKEEMIPVQIIAAKPETAPAVEIPEMKMDDMLVMPAPQMMTPAMEKESTPAKMMEQETAAAEPAMPMEAQIEPTPAPKTTA